MCREYKSIPQNMTKEGEFSPSSLFFCAREEESWFWGFLFASSAVIGNACRTKNWLMLLSLTCAQPPTASSLETELLSIHTKVCTGKFVEYNKRYLRRYLYSFWLDELFFIDCCFLSSNQKSTFVSLDRCTIEF